MSSPQTPPQIPNLRKSWRKRCTGQRFSLLRHLRCGWHWEKWRTRCSYPASASPRRNCSSLVIAFFTRICRPRFPPFSLQDNLSSLLLNDVQRQFPKQRELITGTAKKEQQGPRNREGSLATAGSFPLCF